jgi:hypothetical protein
LRKALRLIIPVAVGLGLAAVIIFSYLNFFSGAFSPEDAVKGYIRASMVQDVNDMLRYSSEYQKVVLYGSRDYTDGKLKNRLKTAYKDSESIYADSKISFSVESVIEIRDDTDEYAYVSAEYEYMTGKTDISDISQVTVKVFVDGQQKQKSTVYAVKSGISWYYTDI